ncbi:CocE/NonD hydrolase [Thozetella sp. PMI_491]|nr:CocE/NonD hydrolase [Thozetella sp. PMI_491]
MKKPKARSIFGFALDRLVTAQFGLPPETNSYTITPVRVPVSTADEGEIFLAGDLYQPNLPPNKAPAGTVFVHGPYGRGLIFASTLPRPFAARGYIVLFTSCRGTFGSGGTFQAETTDAADTQAVVRYMRKQHWYTGSFATVGMSYLGQTQWALLREPPEDMVAACIWIAPHDIGKHLWGTRAFNLDLVGWSDMVMNQEKKVLGVLPSMGLLTAKGRLKPILNNVPLQKAIDEHFRRNGAPWLRERVGRPDLEDPFWEPVQHGIALDKVNVPVLLVTGWMDFFLPLTMEQYARLQARGCPVALTAGPWTHPKTMAAPLVRQKILEWLNVHLAKRFEQNRSKAVQFCITTSRGAKEWREIEQWPPLGTERTFFLAGDKRLVTKNDTQQTVLSFLFDPERPTPTVSGPLLFGGGRANDSALAAQKDVLPFTSAPLAEDLIVVGQPRVELTHRGENLHMDLFVRLSEVDPSGRSYNVTEGYEARSESRHGTKRRAADAGHGTSILQRLCIRLYVAGGCHPQFARNLGTSENPGTGKHMRKAMRKISCGRELSRIVLSVIQ